MRARIVMVAQAIGRRLLAVGHAIVPDDTDNPQPVIAENAGSSHRLRDAVRFQFSPLFHGGLISKK